MRRKRPGCDYSQGVVDSHGKCGVYQCNKMRRRLIVTAVKTGMCGIRSCGGLRLLEKQGGCGDPPV